MVKKASGHQCQKPVSNCLSLPPSESVPWPWTNHVIFLGSSQVLFSLDLGCPAGL